MINLEDQDHGQKNGFRREVRIKTLSNNTSNNSSSIGKIEAKKRVEICHLTIGSQVELLLK